MTDDWDELYELARDRLPEVYRALVRLDHSISRRVGAGPTDEKLVSHMADHDALTAALRVVRRVNDA